MTNVLSVIHYPVWGGPSSCACFVNQQLAPRGYNTTVVLPADPENSVDRFRAAGLEPLTIPLHRLRALKDPRVQVEYLRAFNGEVAHLQRIIREREIDVVLVNASANPHAALAAEREGVALVWALIDTYPPQLFLRGMMHLVRRWSDVVMTNGMTTAAMHPGIIEWDGPLISFGPWVPVETFTPDPTVRAAARAELGFAPDDVVVGSVNNLNPQKGYHTFLKAAAQLRQDRQVRFLILGAYNTPEYQAAIESEIARLGLRPGTDIVIQNAGARVPELAQALDVFWMTPEPRAEGMSTALAEAQALGLPVVVTRSGSVHETMRDGSTGFLIAPYDTDAIVRATNRLLDDHELYRRFSENAMAHIRANYTDKITAEKHAEAYDLAIEIRARKNKQRANA